MTACCGAGTLVAELDDALVGYGQCVAIPPHGTVGGALAVGRSGMRRLGYGPVRDTLLQARYVSAAGDVVKAGGPTVKNVSGFDLCRLLVGSLRHARIPRRSDPADAATSQVRAVVRDERRSVRDAGVVVPADVGALGRRHDVGAPRRRRARRRPRRPSHIGSTSVSGPPELPTGGRWSLPPASLRGPRAGRSSPRSASASCTTPSRRRTRWSSDEVRRSCTAGSSTTSTRPAASIPASTYSMLAERPFVDRPPGDLAAATRFAVRGRGRSRPRPAGAPEPRHERDLPVAVTPCCACHISTVRR